MAILARDGITFHYRDEGGGLPFVFQHGLGGDVNQPFGFFEDLLASSPPFRLVSLDCRAHGETRPVGPEEKIGIAPFADDVLALMDALDMPQAVVGGISMGAAVALNMTLRFPERVMGLILSRPAWLDAPMPENLAVLTRIAALIRRYGACEGRAHFLRSEDYARVLDESIDVAHSLLGQFDHPRAEETVVKLERIPRDTACQGGAEWAKIAVPVLILANRQDPVHPYALAETTAASIPAAEFRIVTPKSQSVDDHTQDVREEILDFIQRHWTSKP